MASDILPFATGGGANVIDQATYAALTTLLANGFSAGIAESAKLNKVWRQSSFMAAGLAGLASDYGQNIVDDGNMTALKAALDAFLTAKVNAVAQTGFSTGDRKETYKTAADTGWVMMNDGTIGDASSGGTTRANADCQALFTLLWNNISDTNCPVSTGRGVSAAADWAAHKTIRLPLVRGRAGAAAGAGTGLTSRALGETLGEETHVLTTGEMPSHNHSITDPAHAHTYEIPNLGADSTLGSYVDQSAAGPTPSVTFVTNNSATGITINNNGGGGAHNNMQPTEFHNIMIKL